MSLAKSALAAAGAWTLFVLLVLFFNAAVYGMQVDWTHLKGNSVIVLTAALFSVGQRGLLVRGTRKPLGQQVLLAVLLVFVSALLFEFAHRLIVSVLWTKWDPLLSDVPKVAAISLFWIAPFAIWVAGNLVLLREGEIRRRDRRMATLQEQAREAEIRALRYQINPHFLYNTLNTVATLILDRRNDAAEAAVLRLSDFFRASLAQPPTQDVRLGDEIALQQLYLSIEQLRFEEALHVSIDLPPDLIDAIVPNLILQPLVENALKHAVPTPDKPLRLRIAATRQGERILIEVADNGVGDAGAKGFGIGLANVADRLRTRFGESATLSRHKGADGFRAQLSFPIERR
jgi:hypothetical protein